MLMKIKEVYKLYERDKEVLNKEIQTKYCPVCKENTVHYEFKPYFMSDTKYCSKCKVIMADYE